jgi:diguanylate cyclase (GGDEF)-like protein
MLMIDSDNLKEINDRCGHDAGNRMLKTVAKSIAGELRNTDVLARYGGDEFIVLLPETPPARAIDVAERIRRAIETSPTDFGGERLQTSVSIGVACYPEDGRSLDTLQARADRAMYVAKRQGRNQVARFTP